MSIVDQVNDPFESEEYARFVAGMVPICHCHESNKPCDGVLAGGICDGRVEGQISEHDDDIDWDFNDQEIFKP